MRTVEDCPLVIVTWVDSAQATPGWEFVSDYRPRAPIRCASVGWLMQDDDEAVVLAQSCGDIDEVYGAQAAGLKTIPKVAVSGIQHLTEIEEVAEAAE